MHVAVYKVCGPCEVLRLDVYGIQCNLDTVRLHLCDVTILSWLTTGTQSIDYTDKVVVAAAVDIECKVDAVIEEACVDTEVQLVLLLVCQLVIGKLCYIETRLIVAGRGTPRVLGHDYHT